MNKILNRVFNNKQADIYTGMSALALSNAICIKFDLVQIHATQQFTVSVIFIVFAVISNTVFYKE